MPPDGRSLRRRITIWAVPRSSEVVSANPPGIFKHRRIDLAPRLMFHGGHDIPRRGIHANTSFPRPTEHPEGTRPARGDRPEPLVLVELGGGATLHPAESRSLGAVVPEPGADARDIAAGGPRNRREGRELRRERRAGASVVPGVPEEDVVVPGGPLR